MVHLTWRALLALRGDVSSHGASLHRACDKTYHNDKLDILITSGQLHPNLDGLPRITCPKCAVLWDEALEKRPPYGEDQTKETP